MYQVLSEEGVPVEGFSLKPSMLLSMYRDMVLSRVLDRWLMRLQRMGRVGIHAPSEGQEGTYVGSAYALEKEDWIFPLYRELPVYVARKVPLEQLLNRFLSNSGDPLKGHDFAVFGSREHRIVAAPVAVSLHIPTAVGFAMALKKRKAGHVVVNYFGDGATSRGDFHEALNFAGVFKPPIVFFCVNNHYSISLPVSRQTASNTLAEKAVAYGLEGLRVDGNDVAACYVVGGRAVEKARRGEGPTLVEALTYRIGPHTTADDPARYRSVEEVESWKGRDPLKRVKAFLMNEGFWSEKEDADMWREYDKTVAEAVEESSWMPPLKPTSILEDVYWEPPWNLREAAEELTQLA
ncbi:MAG: thiamine pyrophosphate-dependent dehydrogenase E1 component subunit alpha [Candidatus Caldarchaeum sp.]